MIPTPSTSSPASTSSLLARARSIAPLLGDLVDTAVAVISPRTARTRMADRAALKLRAYDSAKTTRQTGDWYAPGSDINSITRASNETIRNRSRELTRNFPYFKRAIDILTTYTVGTGHIYKSLVRDADGKLDKKTNQKIESAVAFAMDELDITGDLHGHELATLNVKKEIEDGEFINIRRLLKDKNRYIPYCLQAIESDWLDSLPMGALAGNVLDQGVEYDPKTGQKKRYHFRTPPTSGFFGLFNSAPTEFILDADQVILEFETLRPNQLRGVSAFQSALLIARDLSMYLDAEIDGAKAAAKYMAMIETPTPDDFRIGQTTGPQGQKIDAMENAIIEYLRPGEKINFASHNRPGDSFVPFTRFILRIVAITTGTTYEFLSGDYEGLNYANLKGIRNDFGVMNRPRSMRLDRHFYQPVTRDIVKHCVLNGKLSLPGYWKNPERYLIGKFIGPGMPSPDPLREGRAALDAIDGRLMSRQQWAAERGQSIDEVFDELQEEEEMMKERNITPLKTSTALATNPAAVAPGTADTSSTTSTQSTASVIPMKKGAAK